MLSLYVIGCGGIGGHLLAHLLETIASADLDRLEKVLPEEKFTQLLENFGQEAFPSIVDRIVLVDGDEYSPRNALRQGHASGSKMENWFYELEHSAIRKTFCRFPQLLGYNMYINPGNMGKIIPQFPDRNLANSGGALASVLGTESELIRVTYPGARDVPVIFLCVDNLKTRYEVSKYVESFANVLLIHGGNEKTTGEVAVYERRDGVALDPNLPDVFPNITADADKRPDEVDPCTYISPHHDQVSDTNEMIAIHMRRLFSQWVRDGLGTAGLKGKERFNEILIDLNTHSSMAVYHPPRK